MKRGMLAVGVDCRALQGGGVTALSHSSAALATVALLPSAVWVPARTAVPTMAWWASASRFLAKVF